MSGTTKPTETKPKPKSHLPWFTYGEQILWAVCLTCFLGFLAVHLAFRYLGSDRFIDIETANPRNANFLVELNSAAWPELVILPGISETFAKRITAYREQHGPFRSIEELTNVPGIGQKKLNQLRAFLYVEDHAVQVQPTASQSEYANR